MTNKKSLYILASVALAMGMQSCGDFLDHLPDDRTEIDSVDKVQKLLMNAYPDCNYYWICELSSDNLLDNQTPHLPSSPSKKQVTTYYNYAPFDLWDDELYRFDLARTATYGDSDSPGRAWMGYYNSIAVCNYCIEALDKLEAEGMTPTDKTRALRAEAQIIRAYDHFYLANIFSQAYADQASNEKNIGVPYVLEPETTMIKEYDRGTVAETYQMIQKDLEEALPNISDHYFKATKYHFNSQAAHAFASRFYLFTHQWDKVIEHADAVLGTDSASVEKQMMDYSRFDDCSTMSDYGKVWQDPEQPSNLMMLATYSLLGRRIFGYRYSLAGEKCQEVILFRSSGNYWGGYYVPIQAVVSGQVASNNTHDYGIFSAKVSEEFEYSDKLAGIGYPHVMVRAFTTASLLLERAEAKLMKGDLAGASTDLCQYWNSPYKHFSDANKEKMAKYYTMITDKNIKDSFTQFMTETEDKNGLTVTKRKLSNRNCLLLEEWQNNAANVGNVYHVTQEMLPYMNCLNEFRRFENSFEGGRFFDLKRWGIPYEHHQGSNDDVYTMAGVDDKRALELPWESISAGLEPSRIPVAKDTREISVNSKDLRIAE